MNDAHNALDVNNGQQACRRYIYTIVADPRHPHCTTYILLPTLLRSILLSRCATFPRQLVRPRIAILFLLPRVYFSPFFFILKAGCTWSEQETPWESEQSVFRSCVTHSGPRYRRAVKNTRARTL